MPASQRDPKAAPNALEELPPEAGRRACARSSPATQMWPLPPCGPASPPRWPSPCRRRVPRGSAVPPGPRRRSAFALSARLPAAHVWPLVLHPLPRPSALPHMWTHTHVHSRHTHSHTHRHSQHSHSRIHKHTQIPHTYSHSYIRTHTLTHSHAHTFIHNAHTDAHRSTYTHTHSHKHTHVHTHPHTCSLTDCHTHLLTHSHILTRVHIHPHTRSVTLTCSHTHIHTHSYIHTCTHSHTLIHTHVHTNVSTRTHTCTFTHILRLTHTNSRTPTDAHARAPSAWLTPPTLYGVPVPGSEAGSAPPSGAVGAAPCEPRPCPGRGLPAAHTALCPLHPAVASSEAETVSARG